jgi:hypothetical protein
VPAVSVCLAANIDELRDRLDTLQNDLVQLPQPGARLGAETFTADGRGWFGEVVEALGFFQLSRFAKSAGTGKPKLVQPHNVLAAAKLAARRQCAGNPLSA